jgi:outer membrane protein assembly factor BamB
MRLKWVLGGCSVALAAALVASVSIRNATAEAGPPTIPAPGSDWPQFRGGPWHSGTNPYETVLGPGNVSDLSVKWHSPLNASVSSPVVRDGVVYIGSAADSSLYALREGDGRLAWTAKLGAFVDSTPAVAKGFVLVGSGDHKLYAFRTDDGSPAWSAQTGGEIFSSPGVVGDVVYVASGDGSVYAYDLVDGRLLWRAPLDVSFYASPAVADGSVFVGSGYGTFYALDAATGAQRWTFTPPSGGGIFGSAAIRGGVVYAGSSNGTIFALDAATGAVRWSIETHRRVGSSPAVTAESVYLTLHTGGQHPVEILQARRRSDGHLRWSHTYGNLIGSSVFESSPSVANGVVYAGFLDGKVRAFAANTGATLWEYADSAFYASPAVVDGQIFIAGNGSNVYDFALP